MNIKIYLLVIVLVICTININAQSPAQHPDWKVVWRDNFDFFDKNKWKKAHNKGRHEEWFNANNVQVIDGKLVLKASNHQCPFDIGKDKAYAGAECSSDRPIGNFKYGYFEAKIRMPDNLCFFPAFWLSLKHDHYLNRTWPPEIDIVEFFAKNVPIAYGTQHITSCSDKKSTAQKGYQKKLENPYGNYYIYGLEWDEHKIKWYINNQQVGTTIRKHVTHDFLRLVFSFQLKSINPNQLKIDFNAPDKKMYVDWVRVYQHKEAIKQQDYQKWRRIWLNRGNPVLGHWPIHPSDDHLIGDFDGDQKEEIFSIQTDGKAFALQQPERQKNKVSWKLMWALKVGGTLGDWNPQPKDSYLKGDFNGNGKEELLCIANKSKYSQLLAFEQQQWKTIWQNKSKFRIGGKCLKKMQQFLVADFDGDGKDDILTITKNYKKCYIFSYKDDEWKVLYDNPVKKFLDKYKLHPKDKYIVGDLDKNGQAELLLINSTLGYMTALELRQGKWETNYTDKSILRLDSICNLEQDNRYYVFSDQKKNDKLLYISADHKFVKIVDYVDGNWAVTWHNAGSYQVYNRDLSPSDNFYFGNFFGFPDSPQVLWVKQPYHYCPQSTIIQLYQTP